MHDYELPEFIDPDTLTDVSKVRVPDEAILRCFVKAPKPYLSKSAIADMTDLSNEGVRKRLKGLEERGVILSGEAGKQTKIYWLNDPRSRWPVPRDLDNPLPAEQRDIFDKLSDMNNILIHVIFMASTVVGLYLLAWLSSLPVTDGVFEVSLNWSMMPGLAFLLLAVLAYVSFRISLFVDDKNAGWPTIRRTYEMVGSRTSET